MHSIPPGTRKHGRVNYPDSNPISHGCNLKVNVRDLNANKYWQGEPFSVVQSSRRELFSVVQSNYYFKRDTHLITNDPTEDTHLIMNDPFPQDNYVTLNFSYSSRNKRTNHLTTTKPPKWSPGPSPD
jgi:hypothetical protein